MVYNITMMDPCGTRWISEGGGRIGESRSARGNRRISGRLAHAPRKDGKILYSFKISGMRTLTELISSCL